MDKCICKGNWRLLVKKYEPFLNKKYKNEKGKVYTFFGLVHADEDYYFGMVSKNGKMLLLSCVGDIEDFGYTLINQ